VYHCPEGCQPTDLSGTRIDAPFRISPGCLPHNCQHGDPETECGPQCEFEFGLLVYPDGSVTNRWTDGEAGVPDWLREAAQDHLDGGCPPDCIECGEEAHWRPEPGDEPGTKRVSRDGWVLAFGWRA
jgi:hypothetical protein